MSRTLAYLFAMSWGAAAALAAFAVFCPVRRRRLSAGCMRSPLHRETVLALFWMFCGGMAVVALTPRWVVWALVDLKNHGIWNAAGNPCFAWGSVNWVPFRTFAADTHSLYILMGNIILFLPFGFFAALLWRGIDRKRIFLLGLGISGGIECWQLLVGRTFDVDDLLLNTLGTVAGFWLWRLADHVLPCRLRQCRCVDMKVRSNVKNH